MSDTSIAAVLLLPLGVVALAGVAASANGALDARSKGAPMRSGFAAPLWDTARLLRQQRRTIPGADSLLWRIAGAGLGIAAVLKMLVIPFGGFTFADLPVGLVWFNAMDVLLWALWWLLGWGANSTWSLVGGYRFLAQALSYEIPLMFALTAPAIGAGSLRLLDVQAAQHHLWFIVWMPVAFVVFAASVVAFSSWGPFHTALGKDISGGVLSELSGIDRLLVLGGRYAVLVAGAAFSVPLFLGGGAGPLLPASIWVVVKTCLVLAALLGLRRLFPMVRPDRLAEIAWVIVVPVVLVQLAVVAVVVGVNGGAL
ncbi:NADH-quinone oxidoreductase subunit H [Glaciihabitans sp. INWT7]|uniref:complex I subunit 1 family protein n=1 Tax=Glaciihabitans sp. INWT7 TaxID=2596912 RepID=UPI0016272309|nr:complex I subunit 1 family protein [Glaciihabitans sp. INWT7]QNE46219.1 NADH-quinone oxidoreductase subunit H [Glaciihabitans sp. INWT7]